MPLSGLLEEVDKLVQGQVVGAPMARPARALGPQAWPGRGHGIRALDDLLAHLSVIETFTPPPPHKPLPFPRKEIAHRLRLAARPFLWNSHFVEKSGEAVVSRMKREWAEAPTWYWDEALPATVTPSVSWEAVATTGYMDVRDNDAPSSRVGLWPLWLVLGAPKLDFRDPILGNFGTGHSSPPGLPQPSVLPDENLRITLLGSVARAWIDWNRVRRVARGGQPVSSWAAQESGPFDLQPLRTAVARTAPIEDVYGCVDALVIGRLAADKPSSSLLRDYYGPGLSPGLQHHRVRMHALFETSPNGSALHGLVFGSPGFVGSLTQTLHPLLHWTLRMLSLLEPWWHHSEIETPWGRAALDVLTDELADLLSAQGSRHFGVWPSAGFGVRRFNATTHRPEPMYGDWDLQFGDDDATSRFAGSLRAGGAAGHVAALVNDLRQLGFTAPAAATTRFDARVAMAVREFQIEAMQERLSIDQGGVQHALQMRSPRRYFGRVHGVVDGETRRLLQLWLNLPRVEADSPPLGTAGTQARNGLQIVACVATAGGTAIASAVAADDVWGPMGTPGPTGVDNFDHVLQGHRHWAIDRLLRHGAPVAAEAPALAAFGSNVPAADVDALPLGRYSPAEIGGPVTMSSDHWRSTLLTWIRFQDAPSPDVTARPNDWRVLYGITYPESGGFEDVVNGYDIALLSIGWCHWTLKLPGGLGELGAFLAWYKHRDPGGFHRDFGRHGLDAPAWGPGGAVIAQGPGKHVADVRMWGAGDPNQTLDLAQAVPPHGSQASLRHTWMRSWRSVFRCLQAARLSAGFRRANREFALRRVFMVLHHPYPFAATGFSAAPTIGALACSEQAVVALMRWHVNVPGPLMNTIAGQPPRLRSAVDDAVNAYLAVPPAWAAGTVINVATLSNPADARARAFQDALIERLLAATEPANTGAMCQPYVQPPPPAPQLPKTANVRACWAVHHSPEILPLSRSPGSYVLPPVVPPSWA